MRNLYDVEGSYTGHECLFKREVKEMSEYEYGDYTEKSVSWWESQEMENVEREANLFQDERINDFEWDWLDRGNDLS